MASVELSVLHQFAYVNVISLMLTLKAATFLVKTGNKEARKWTPRPKFNNQTVSVSIISSRLCFLQSCAKNNDLCVHF